MHVRISSRGCVRSGKSRTGNHVIKGGAVPVLLSTLIKTEPVEVKGGDILGSNKPVGIISPPPANPLGGSLRLHRGDLLNSLQSFGVIKKGESKRDNIKFIF